MRLRLLLCALLALAAALPAAAQEPEAAYAGYHRAALARDLADLMRFSDDARRAEVAAMSDAQKAAEAKMASALMPPTYTVSKRELAPDGKSARLIVQGTGSPLAGQKPETLYGTVRLVLQGGEWRVAGVDWSNLDPGVAERAFRAKEAAKPAAQAPASRASAPIGSLESGPVRKLGTQKPPCVYKPVMTQEDLDNCK